MEVFLRGVPEDLTDASFRTELIPFMKSLNIDDWTCEKPRKRTLAWVTFLHTKDASSFLAKHGKQLLGESQPHVNNNQGPGIIKPARAKAIARMFVLKRPIYIEKSTRPVDALVISRLESGKERRQHPTPKYPTTKHNRYNHVTSTVCRATRIDCGKTVFSESGQLTFISQTDTRDVLTLKFGQRFAIVSTDYLEEVYIEYRTVKDCIVNEIDSSFTFVLSEPPRMYEQTIQLGTSYTNLVRKSHLWSMANHEKYVAHCLVYRVSCVSDGFQKIASGLKDSEILTMTRSAINFTARPQPYIDDYATCMRAFEGKIQQIGNSGRIFPFVVLFQVQALVWGNYLHPKAALDVLAIMQNRLGTPPSGDQKPGIFTASSMKCLFQSIPYIHTATDPSEMDLEALVESAFQPLENEDDAMDLTYGGELQQHHAWVLKAMVTPTRILLHGPDAESKNRVLRKFAGQPDYFLRVSFSDEDGQDLNFNPKISNEEVYARYQRILEQGISVAGRKFHFLGFSHSSLRSHSAWFSASFIDSDRKRQTCESILKSLGDFQEIRIPAKCAARIGQAFSETPYAVPLADINVRYIDDVKNADGSRVFSDGVGTISQAALTKVWKSLPPGAMNYPTCIQIRLAGINGMLSLDSRLTGTVINIRKESMQKFPSKDFQEIGICDTSSRPLKLVLNRQIIKILEDMGTDAEWFLNLQRKALRYLQGVTASAKNTSTFIGYQGIGNNIGLPRFLKALGHIEIDYRRDEFLKSVVDHVVLRELRLLKYKARIPVNKGVTLFGIMDETGFLGEGEVFVTFDVKKSKEYNGIAAAPTSGVVLITRSPALHPGDIQVAMLQTPPKGHPLRELRNCVVFSQRGKRDLPSQLSGGDLDGDLYSIIWDEDALPLHHFTPADYPRVTPEPLDRAVTQKDIATFFINFMKTDVLGLIASRHQLYADVEPDGTASNGCVILAELHSTAVDYSKTGIPVPVGDIPKAPKTRPDL